MNVMERVDSVIRHTVPIMVTFGLVLVTVLPIRLPSLSQITPDLATIAPALPLIAVFFWSIHRPEVMPPIVAFSIGLFQDLLGGGLVGVNTFLLTAVQGAVSSQQRLFQGKSFLVAWWGFAIVAVLVGLATWLIRSFDTGTLVSVEAVIFEYLLTILLYPFIGWILAQVQHVFVR